MKDIFKYFKKFHGENPQVYDELKRYSERVFQTKPCYSIYALMHIVRFNFDIHTTGKPFKISNDVIPFYARMIVLECPQYKGFFRIKGGVHVDNIKDSEILEVINQ